MSPVFGAGSVLAPARQVPRAVLVFADAAADGMTARRALEALGGIRGLDRDPSIGLRAQIQRDAIDAVLCCITSKGTQPVPLLEVIAAAHPQAPVMLLADQGAEERADEAISGGAWGYLVRTPRYVQRLHRALLTAVAQRRLELRHRIAEDSARAFRRARDVMMECSRVLIRATDEQALLDAMCRNVVEIGGYPVAWVGMAIDDAPQTIRCVARHGDDRGYLDTVALSWTSQASKAGVSGMAIRTGLPQIARDVGTDSRWSAARRKTAIRSGIRSAVALPLICDEIVLGVFTIYAPEVLAFDEQELALLGELVNDLGYGLGNLRARRAMEVAQVELRKSESRFEATFSQAPVAVATMDLEGRFLRVNPAMCALVGYTAAELCAGTALDLTFPDDRKATRYWCSMLQGADAAPVEFEKRYVRKDGTTVWVCAALSRARVLPSEAPYLIGMLQDITAKKEAADRLEFLARYDPLTKLPNRRLLLEELDRALAAPTAVEHGVGILFLDLDRFKDVNDKFGHVVADDVLFQVARRLEQAIRDGATLGRLGGDEFAIIVPLVRYDEEAIVAQRVLDALMLPFEVEERRIHLSGSLGIAVFPTDGADADALMRHADAAMYEAKHSGRSTFKHYLPAMSARIDDRIRLEAELRLAMLRDEFRVYYQPKFSLVDLSVSGLEALLRWQHPKRGLVMPSEFIPVLEHTGLIVQVGEWVLRTVCMQARAWRDHGIPALPVAVNVSARQFQQKNLDQVIKSIVEASGLSPTSIELELTETLLMSDADESVRVLASLRAAGLRLTIDDFGTGYSSLAYLSRFPIDVLKIDRAFVRNMMADATDAAIVVSVIRLAHSLGMTVVGEGVETEEQLDLLRLRGCDEIQGYYSARPMPAAECTVLLFEGRRLS